MTFPLAQSGLTFLIYLIVGGVWLLGNILQQKQAREKAAEMRRKREEREREERRTGKKTAPKTQPPRNDLESFLRSLSGQPPAKPAAPPPVPRRPASEPDIVFDGPKPPPPPTVRKTAPPPVVTPPVKTKMTRKQSNLGEMNMEASFKQMSQMKEAAELFGDGKDQQLQQEALKNVRAMMIDLSSSSISVPIIPLQTIRAIRTETPRPDLQKRRNFKKALVASVILEAPKALREKPFTEIV